MTVDEFVEKSKGTKVDFDKAYGAQCVDLFRQYCADVLGAKKQPAAVVGAKDFYGNYVNDGALQELFEKLPAGAAPESGDVVFWGASAGNKYGHVAIVLGCEGHSLTVLEQDGFRQDGAKVVRRFTDGVLGYMRPKKRETEA